MINGNSFSQIGAKIRQNVASKLFSGIKTTGNVNALQMQRRRVMGSFRQTPSTIINHTIFTCGIDTCEDTSICGL